MRFAVRKQLKRKMKEGKESEVSVNGRPIPQRKMQRFMERKGICEDEILAWTAGMWISKVCVWHF